MAKLKLHLTLTPKPATKSKPALTNTDIAQAIKLRSMIVDYKATGMAAEIIAEVTKAITVPAVKDGISKKELKGLPGSDFAGKHELYIYLGADKATKIELTIEPEPVFDIKKECPLFADDKGKKANAEYCGGGADEPHVHVYGGGFHLKLGRDRYNIVQDGKLYEGKVKEAHTALNSHPKKNDLAPFVAAALKKFGFL